MPSSPPNPVQEENLNSIAPPSTKKKSNAKTNLRDYPSFAQQKTANPVLKRTTNALNNAGLALKRLGLTEADIEDVPEVTPRVKEAMGSVREAISLLRGDDAPDSRKFIRKWDSLSPRDQKSARLEHVVTAAGLTTRRFMELLAGAEFDHSATVSKIFVSRSQLKVLKSTVKAATDEQPIFNKDGDIIGQSNGDVKAMEIFHKITGAMPTPKGGTFINNQQINAQVAAPNEPKTPLQAMDSFLLEIDDIRRPKQLSAHTEPIIPVEMPDNLPEIEYLDTQDLGEGV